MAAKDVELVIRARDAATKTVQAIVGALNDLKAAQAGVAAGAGNTSNVIGELANAYAGLERQIEGLQGFGKVAREMERAGGAVERLDQSVQKSTQEQAKLEAAQERAAAAAAQANQARATAKSTLDAEKARLAQLAEQAGRTSAAYKEQKAAVDAAKIAYREASAASRTAETEQRRIDAAVQESAASLERQRNALAGARAQYAEISGAAKQASAALGGVEASQDAVSAASKRAAADLDRVGQALVRQRAPRAAPTAQLTGSAAEQAAAFRAQIEAVRQAGAVYEQARAEASRLGKEIAATAEPTLQLRTDFLLAKEAALAAKTAYQEQAAALNQLREAARSASSARAQPAPAVLSQADVQATLRRPAAVAATATAPAGEAAQATAAYRQQVEAVKAAGVAYEAARAEATRLGRELATTSAPTEALATAFKQAQQAALAAKTAYHEQAVALTELRGASGGGFKAVDDLARKMAQVPQQTTQVRGLLALLGLGQRQVNAGNNAARKGEVLFGLRPYELQNLSFQINDLITQIASGTSPSQAFAQQFGQIVQIFPRLGAVLIPILPELLGLAAALGIVGASMHQIAEKEASVRQFGAALAASADGSRHSAEALAEAAHQLDVYGTSLKTAREEIKIFVAAGIDDSRLEEFGRTAENAATVFGIKIPDAAKKMADGFSGGMKSIDELDKSFNFLSASERQHIQDLFDAGHAEEARTQAFELFRSKMDDGAQKIRGPWSESIRNLTQAWDNFLHFLGNTAIVQGAIEVLRELAKVARDVTAALPGAQPQSTSQGGNPAIEREIAQLQQLQAERARVAAGRSIGQVAGGIAANTARALLPPGVGQILLPSRPSRTTAEIDQDIAKTQARLNKLKADTHNVVQEGTEAQKKADQRVIQDLQDQYDSLKGINDQKRIQVAGEKAYQAALEAGASESGAAQAKLLAEQIKRTEVAKENAAEARTAESRARALQNRLDAAENQVASAVGGLESKVAAGQVESLQTRLNVIDNEAKKINGEIAHARQTGVKTINGEPLDDVEKRVTKLTEIAKQQATIKFYEESITELEKQRDERLKSISDRFSEGKITAADAFKEEQQANVDLQAQIALTAQAAEDFAKSIRGATPDPKLEAFIDKMDRLRTAPTVGLKTPAAKGGDDLLNQQEHDLNATIAERNAIIQTNNELLHQGVITLGEWRARVEGAYAQTTPEIEKQIAAIQQLLDLLKQQGAITEQTYNAWVAKLQLVGAQTTNLTTQVLSVQDANNLLADSGVSFFDKFAQAVGNGQNAVQAFGQAFLSTVADILLDIGKLILKQELLNLVMQSGIGKGLANGINGIFNTATTTAAAVPLTTAAGALSGSAGALAGSAAPLMTAAAALQAAAFALSVANAGSSAPIFHSGGVVGAANRTRLVNPAIFAGAMRYHVGGIAGLAPGEIPTILQRGEEVLTRNDPRHVLNGGASGGPSAPPTMNIRNVLVLDPAQVESYMASPGGERVILGVLNKNKATVKSMVKS